tara:strand:+ start:879 stop:6770 length:5892 start_codon:yes stop_codon:yes gene_type:complete
MNKLEDPERLKALDALNILGSLEEKEYDSITKLAAAICETPVALVSLVACKQQFFKSRHGLEEKETSIDVSFCKFAIEEEESIFIIEDTREDIRFKNNPLVTGEPFIVFYTGSPLVMNNGLVLGTLCVIDKKPRQLNQLQIEALQTLAKQVVQLLELRKASIQLHANKASLKHESERLKNIIEATEVGTWEWNVQTNEVVINERYAEIVGYTIEELKPINLDMWNRLVHPDDAKLSDEKINDCFSKKSDFYNIECRLIHKNGSIVWINDRGKVIEWTKEGQPLIMTGTHTDITKRKNTETQFKAISDNIPGAVFRYELYPDGTDGVNAVSKGGQSLWGYEIETVLNNFPIIWQNIHELDVQSVVESVNISAEKLIHWNHEWRYKHPDGSIRWHKGSGNPIRLENGSIIWDSIILDITKEKEIELELQLKEDRFRKLVENSGDAIAIVSDAGKIDYVSPSVHSILGYTEEEALNLNLFEIIHPDDIPLIVEKLQEVMKNPGVPIKGTTSRTLHKDGTWRWLEATNTNMLHDPSIGGIIDNFRDVTEKIEAEQKLIEKEKRFRSLVENSGDAFAIMSIDGATKYVSPSIVNVLGYNEEEALSMRLDQIIHPEDIDIVNNTLYQSIQSPGIPQAPSVARVMHKNGNWIYTEAIITNMLHHPEINGIIDNFRDVTSTILAQQKIYLSEKRFKALVQDGSDMTAILSIEGVYQYVSPNYPRYTGYTENELLGLNGFDFFHPDDVTKIKEEYSNLTSEKRVKSSPYRFKRKDGVYCWFQSIGTNLIEDESVGGIVVNTVEITDLIKERNTVKLHNERFEYVNKATNDAIYEWNIEKDLVYWGESFERIFGHKVGAKPEETPLWSSLVHPEDLSNVLEKLNNYLVDSNQLKWFAEYRFLNADGSYAYVEEKAYTIRDKKGMPQKMIGVLSDITDRKKEELRLLLMERVITNANDAVLITEANPLDEPGLKIVYANEAFTEMTGYTEQEVIGKSPRFLQGPKTDRRELDRIDELLKNGESAETTVINYKKNGDEFWINFSMSPVFSKDGELTHFISIERDVSDKVNAEIEKRHISEISGFFKLRTSLMSSLEAVLTYLTRVLDYDIAEIWLPNPKKSIIHQTIKHTETQAGQRFYEASKIYTKFLPNQGLPGIVWVNQKIEVWKGNEGKEAFVRKEAAKKSDLRSAIGIPLFHNNEVVGVLVLASHKEIPVNADKSTLFISLQENLGAEINRKKQEEEMLLLFNSAPEIIAIRDPEGYFVKVNEAFCDLLGYTEQELTSIPYIKFVHPKDVVKTSKKLQSFNEENEGQVHNFVNRYRCKDGSYKWISWSTSKKYGEHGLVFGFGRDLTEVKELEKILDNAAKLANFGTWEVDFIKDYVFWSPMTKEIHEVSPEYEPTAESAHLFFKETHRELVAKKIEESIKEGKSFDIEAIILTANQTEKWVRLIGDPEIENERCIKITGGMQDINKQKHIEIRLKNLINERDSILESIGDAFIALDLDWKVTYWNKEAEKALKMNREDTIDKNFWDIFSKDQFKRFYEEYHRAMETGVTTHFEEYDSTFNQWFEISAYPSEKGLSIYFKDVSIRKVAEEKIKLSNERFEKIAEATNDAIWEYDIERDELFWGRGFTTQFGHDLTKIKPSFELLLSYIHPDDRNQISKKVQTFMVEAANNNWFAEFRFLKSDGTYALVLDRAIFIRDENGKAIKAYGAMTDISYRKEYEDSLKKLNNELEIQTKELASSNAELEQFAYIASHDLQEPLRMISSFLTQLDKKYGDTLDEKAHTYINFAVDGAKRMRKIILDLLEFSRISKQEIKTEKVDLNELLVEVFKLQHKLIESKNAKITYDILPVIKSHYSQLLQVFQNIIGNALKYCKQNQPPEIHISVKKLRREWEFSIEDNGIGIESEYFEKIFIIFQRLHLKEEFEGSGMGLAIVKKIIDKMNGKIWLISKVGAGSTFFFSIPFKINEKKQLS